MIPTTMSTFDELGIELRRRLREHDLNQLELSKVLGILTRPNHKKAPILHPRALS